MSDLFLKIMNIQPNENEFADAARDSKSNETSYQIGFMHGRSYAAQMADEHESRNGNHHHRLREALKNMHAIAEFREARNPEVVAAGELLQELDNLEPKP